MTINSTKSKKAFEKLLNQSDFDFVKKLLDKFPGSEIYLVGGVVRDILLGRESTDIDFVVRNVSPDDLQTFLRSLGVVNLVGKHFGVYKFVPEDASKIYSAYDIALPRTEHSLMSGGYRDVEVQSDPSLALKEDLSRRDFTINALAWDISNKKLIDEHDGLKDLEKKLIRTVGKPSERFGEDFSRILRALRFACQIGFEAEKSTMKEIKKSISHINDKNDKGDRVVPYETIAKELIKSLVADPVHTIDLWAEADAWTHVMPELLEMKNCPQAPEFHSEGDVWVHTRMALQKLASKDCKKFIDEHFPVYCKEIANPLSPEIVVSVLLHDIAKPETLQTPQEHGVDRIRTHEHDTIGALRTREICERLTLASPSELGVDIDHVVWLVRHHLLAAHGPIERLKPTTIEKYFFKDPQRGCNLLLMMYADGSATINPQGEPAIQVVYQMIDRIHEILSHFKKKKAAMKLPKPIVDGDEIMKKFNLKPGKKIGELLHVAREAQLNGDITTKEEAFEVIKKHL